MSISSIGSNSAIDPLLSVVENSQQSSATATVPQDSSQISQAGQLLSQLQQLQQSNPAAFKQVAAQVASNLEQEAKQQTGPAAQALQQIASQFQQASQTGQLPAAQSGSGPTAGGHHHHHGHHAYSGQAGSSADGVSTIVQDTLESALQSAGT